MSNKDKMHTGELYLPGDVEIMKEQQICLDKLYDYNMTRPTESEKRQELLKEMFAEIGEVKPKVVILLGEKVCSAVEKKLNIKLKRWRGFEYFATEHNGIWYLPVQHPSYIYVYKRKEAEKYVEKVAEAIEKIVDDVG